jgi:hypothetical protein
MKRSITLCCLAFAMHFTLPACCQAVLNEIYSDPGKDNQEFFELYNTSTSTTPVSMDDYTVVTYYENGPKEKGFYVLDLPNLLTGPKGYFVGAAALPFNYQGNTGSLAANFSWNDPLLTAKFGYLKQWQLTGPANVPDSQKTYTPGTIPSGFNDLFNKRNGAGASYCTFVYQNGKLVNAFFGGVGGVTQVPAFILSMPPLKVDILTAGGVPNSFTINFNSYQNGYIESVVETTGSDNGFIRTRDGLCGSWDKSSANVFHTPGAMNASAVGAVGSLTIDTHLAISNIPTTPSFINYNITKGPLQMFPVNLQVYLDNGTTPGQLDAGDVFVEQNTETVLSDGPFKTDYMPQKQSILLVAETSLGCLDQVLYLQPPPDAVGITLPVKITLLAAKKENKNVILQWQVADNEKGSYFDVQRSIDGKSFTSIGTVLSTPNTGLGTYVFTDKDVNTKAYYRLRIQHISSEVDYSKTVSITEVLNEKLALLQNPVEHSISFTYTTPDQGSIKANIYNTAGRLMYNGTYQSMPGANTLTIANNMQLTQGVYVLEVIGNKGRSTITFLKR